MLKYVWFGNIGCLINFCINLDGAIFLTKLIFFILFFRTKDLLRQAILENDFLKNLEMGQVKEIVESMYNVEYSDGTYIIREGDIGSMLYIMEGKYLYIIKNIS